MPPATRPYRSRNRRRPCDRCRQRKMRCQTSAGPPCQPCQRSGASCTFTSLDGENSLRAEVAEYSPRTSPELTVLPDAVPGSQGDADGSNGIELWSAPSNQVTDMLSIPTPSTQISQSLDAMDGHCYQLSGASSDEDPWLLRHCKFDDFGLKKFFKVHIRNAGGVPTRDKIPAHFIVSERSIHDTVTPEAGVGHDPDFAMREEINRLVPPDRGQRLLNLFLKRVFPVLPVISRTQLGFSTTETMPKTQILDKIPTHLLAAIYASALAFAPEDNYLSLSIPHHDSSASQLWCLVYKVVVQSSYSPRLSLVQATILYLHKNVRDEHSYAVTDTASLWSLMGMAIGTAHSLGLNLECRLFGLPAAEKRIRRRVWWALFVEDKFMSLMFGRPPYIRQSEWDVTQIDHQDFVTSTPSDPSPLLSTMHFHYMTSLAVIAESIQDKLYSLRACQKLAEDITTSVAEAKPLLHDLSMWREALPLPSGQHSLPVHNDILGINTPFPAAIYQAYLILVVYVWRALLRTTVRSSDPPHIIHIQDAPESPMFLRDLTWGFDNVPEASPQEANYAGSSSVIGELYEAAFSCASSVLEFITGLENASFGEFWHSWLRKGFAAISNFLMLLLVQAPDHAMAIRAKRLLEKWQHVLLYQHKGFPLLMLAKTRLDSYYWSGLEETFNLPAHVKQAVLECN